jgi:SET domain-containing protein
MRQVAGGSGEDVSFYAIRAIAPGEELLLNYGRKVNEA